MTVDRGGTDPTARLPEAGSGTGWPDEDDADSPSDSLPVHRYRADSSRADRTRTVEQALVDRAASRRTAGTATADPDGYDDRPPPGRRRRRWVPFAGASRKMFWLAIVAGAVVIIVLLGGLLGFLKLGNPFSKQTIDRSQPVLLVKIQDLARFEAATGTFDVIIDVQEDRRFIPDVLFSKRSLFVAEGTVDAYVDFAKIGDGAILVDPKNDKVVTITLPAPQLEPANLNLDRTYVYAVQEGLINRVGDLFGGDPNDQQELYQLAQQKINAAALDSELRQRAADNTRSTLVSMFKSLGYTTVNVNFPPIT
jgi:hypothetical protein